MSNWPAPIRKFNLLVGRELAADRPGSGRRPVLDHATAGGLDGSNKNEQKSLGNYVGIPVRAPREILTAS